MCTKPKSSPLNTLLKLQIGHPEGFKSKQFQGPASNAP